MKDTTPKQAKDADQEPRKSPYLNEKEAADYLGMCVKHMREILKDPINRRLLKPYRPHYRCRLFKRENLDKWIESKECI